MYEVTRLSVLICCLYGFANCANILGVFPVPSKSHHIVGVELLKAFAKHGHNVTLVSPFGINERIENFTMIDIPAIVKHKEENMQQMFQANISFFEKFVKKNPFIKILEIFFESNEVQTLISSKDTKFDLVINHMLFNEITLIFGHIFDAPVIGYVGSSGLTHLLGAMGNPSPLSYIPHALLPFTDEMTFFQRVLNTLVFLGLPVFKAIQITPDEERILKQHFPTAPPMEEMLERMDMLFLNTHVSYETPRPYLPNIIQIGGHHLQQAQNLPKKLKEFLDNSAEGVIYVSFGTNVKSSDQPEDVKKAFIEKFSQLKMNVLWKYEEDTLLGISDNVRIEKWLPQRAVLAHPNVKLFIGHGGAGGSMEALYYGVPMLCIPFFADQSQNCARIARNGYSLTFNINDMNKETFSNAIDEMLNNPKYAENMKLRSELYRNQPINPNEHAIYWAEHVIKHKGAKHLKSIAAKIPLYQYILLDVAAFLIAVLVISLLCTYYSVKFIIKKIWIRRKKSKFE